MSAWNLGLLIAGFVAMSVIFLQASRGWVKRNKWMGLVALCAAAPFFFWLGAFAESFKAGLCYSRVGHLIAEAVTSTDSSARLAERIRALPFHGYESVCGEIEAAAEHLSDESRP